MVLRCLSLCLVFFSSLLRCASATGISSGQYDNFVHYFRYASSAYTIWCPRPNGQTNVKQFHDFWTDARGFVARDDSRQEIVVSFAGSATLLDILTDAQVVLRPFDSLGIDPPNGTLVHQGFLRNWNAVSSTVFDAVEAELAIYSDYNLVITGHSMGGAVASLAGISMKTKFPLTRTYLYTYGQPRTGNDVYAYWVNEVLADNVFRIVHSRDWVAKAPPRVVIPFDSKDQNQRILQSGAEILSDQQYRHHGIEYWQNADPPSPDTTVQCSADGEDPDCSNSILVASQVDHTVYFGILATWPFCL